MDRLASMEVFVRVVDAGGFAAAAKAGGISPAMVSNHIQALEKHLGARLLNRTTRRHSLTEIGSAFYDQCVDVLARIAGAETAAREMRLRPTGRLRVSAPITLGTHLLMPALADYLREYPDVTLDLQLNDRTVDLADEGFDAAFRFGVLPDSGLVARPLQQLRRVMCAAPAYLRQRGLPESPSDLATHNCLAFFNVKPEREWQFHGGDHGAETIRTAGQLAVNNGPALLQAALSGLGIVLLPDYLVAAELASGKLVRLFPGADFSSAPLQLVYLPDRHMTPKLRSFIEHILVRFAAEPAT